MRTPEAFSAPPVARDVVRPPEPNPVIPAERRRRGWLAQAIAAGLFLSLVLLFQWLSGAYRSEFAGYPDEAAHYITGLMIRDYVAHGHLQSVKSFAENYYLHYPKVALGHWPPFFYLVQAAWTLAFPISRVSMLLLMALITTLLAILLYRLIEPDYGAIIGFGAGALLITLPLIQQYGSMIMADTLLAVLGLAATMKFAKFMDSGNRRDAIWFGVFASMMILTKGTGLALALVPPVVLLLTGRWNFLRRANFWLPLFIVLPLCAPWYWVTRHMLPNTWEEPQPGGAFVIRALRFYTVHSVRIFGAAILVLAALGFLTKVVIRARRDLESRWAALAALILATATLACIVPAGLEDRFLIPAVPAVLAFMVAGVECVAKQLFPDRPTVRKQQLLILFVTILIFLATAFSIPRDVSSGFAQVAKDILSQPALSKAIVLISSDPIGDGMFVSEIAMREQRPGHYVLRGTKVLCDCSWTGSQHSAIYSTPNAMMAYLEKTPIQIVVDDSSVPERTRMEFNDVLEQTIRFYPERWRLLTSYPITRDGVVYPQGARVYRLLGTNPDLPVTIDLRRMLDRTIQLRPR